MSGINSGILQNVSPLSAEAIKELERKVLETGEAYAYLDQNSKLCFAMPHGVDGIKKLAWNNAYELSSENGTLTKKAYKKTGLKTFTLDKTFTKSSIDEPWLFNSIFRFYGDYANYQYETLLDPAKLVKVSNKFFSKQDLLSSTITIHGYGMDENGTVEYPVTDQMFSCDEAYDETCDATLSGVQVVNSDLVLVMSVNNPANDPAFPKTGTYFLFFEEDQTGDGIIDGTLYTRSISCLTEADAIQPIERLEGDGQFFDTEAPAALSFRSTAPLSEFQGVQINGETVDPSSYTLEEGSTIVKLSQDYLKTLGIGNYEISVVSDSKTVKGSFIVTPRELSEYGFYYNHPYILSNGELGTLVLILCKKTTYLDNEIQCAIAIIGDERVAYLYTVDGNIVTLHPLADGDAIPLLIDTDTLTMVDVSGEPIPGYTLALNKTNTVAATDGVHLYKLNQDGKSYSVSCLNIGTIAQWKQMQASVNNLPVTTIPNDAYALVKLSQPAFVEIPYGVESIGDGAFSEFDGELGIRLPSTVKHLGSYISYESVIHFYIDSIEHWCCITFDGAPIQYTGFGDCKLYIDDKLVTDLVIPDSVTVVPENAFTSYSSLKSVSLPKTTQKITNAFVGCESLERIVFRGTCQEFAAIEKIDGWHDLVPASKVSCVDGDYTL